jgi:hypothetical protein
VGVAAAEAGHRVRYVTCAQLVNELAEAADERMLSLVVAATDGSTFSVPTNWAT